VYEDKLSIITGIGFATGLAVFIWLAGSRNPVTGAGYVGYLTQGAIFGQTRFHGLQKGPTSPGRTWLLDVVNVSVTPYTYSEDFADKQSVLSRDNLKISFRVHVVWKVREDRVKEFVERYSTLYSNEHSDRIVETAYANFLREPLRTFARDEIQKLNGLEVKEQFTPIGDAILRRVQTLTTNSPFEIASVVVGNVQYPETVAAAVAEKLAATQVLERKRTEIEIAQAEAAKRVVEAEGIARSMQIINERLTVTYLQHEAIEAQKAMVGSPNHTTIYIPVGAMGVPVVDLVDKGRTDGVATAKTAGPSAR
jgi:regulator of protease activity HflC (stomatin/prohibitin superfamily)